jgi:hypothetical protein
MPITSYLPQKQSFSNFSPSKKNKKIITEGPQEFKTESITMKTVCITIYANLKRASNNY